MESPGLRRIQKAAQVLEALSRPDTFSTAFSDILLLGGSPRLDVLPLVLRDQLVGVAVDPEDPDHWTVKVAPTVGTCASVALFGVEVTLCIQFPEEYPSKPFTVAFDNAWVKGVTEGFSRTIAAATVGPPVVSEALPPVTKAETAEPREPIRIVVTTYLGSVHTIEHLTLSSTIDELRLMVLDSEDLPRSGRYRLLYGATPMEDGRTVADYVTRRDETIYLGLRPPGWFERPMNSEWLWLLPIFALLCNLNRSIFAAETAAAGHCLWSRRDLQRLHATHDTLDLVQWAGRCSSPARGIVWSPSNDARWPLLFRKIVRYVRRIGVRAESHATRQTLPLDVVERIAAFL